jgi:hypothetical protein
LYNITPKSKEWLTIICVVNATGITLPKYIFRKERICDDYIQLCKPKTCMAMQSKAWMTTYLFKEFLSFFKRSIPSEISLTNRHLHILDGHGSHVTLETIKQAKEFGLDMIVLPLHTSRALHPLDIMACFKPFKIVFKRERNTTRFSRNYIELNKIALVGWVNKILDQTFTRKYHVRVQRYKDLAI